MPAPKNIAVVINPHSAGGRTLTAWPVFEKKLQADGFYISSHISASEADFRTQIVKFAQTFKELAVCGGDSSLTIAAEELGAKNFSGRLRFLPAGSVNDIVLDIAEQNREKDSVVYLGHLSASGDTHSFIGQANWGLGVVVNRWVGKVLHTLPFLRLLQNLIGTLSIIVAHLLRKEKVSLQIQADKTTLKGEYSIVLVSQIRHWASGMRFCPDAGYLKPEFQVVTVARCGLFRLIKIILAAKTGGHLRFAEVSTTTAKQVEIHSEKPLQVQIDGDIPNLKSRDFSLKKKKTGFRLAL